MIVKANLRHSQSATASPLKSWVAAEKYGIVLCSHCTCVAGLGGACSHIAALLFAVEAHNRDEYVVECLATVMSMWWTIVYSHSFLSALFDPSTMDLLYCDLLVHHSHVHGFLVQFS